jgi:PhnB protein
MHSVATSKVKPIPEGYHSITPVVIADGASSLIDFLRQVFDAEERVVGSDGRIRHAEVRIGDSLIMVSDSSSEFPAFPAMVNVYVEDVDAAYKRALDEGAASLREPSNQFYGDRTGGVKDQFGNQWWIATHVEDVSEEELEKRMRARESH